MAIDPRFVTAVSLDPCLLDKVTGLPLVGGSVYFFQDDNRIFPKPVYELSGAPPNYTYTELPNPMILGPKGNFVDNTGADVAVYYFPYDDTPEADLQLYYITVFNAQGVPQFDRQAWPNVTAETAPGEEGNGSTSNIILNGQFGFVNFPTTETITIPGIVANAVYPVAPGWSVLVSTTGAATVTLTQNPIAGANNYPGQPPYTLSVTGSANITSLILQQVFTGNPNIFSQNAADFGGFVNTSVLVAPGSSIAINYVPNDAQPIQNLINVPTNVSGLFQEYNSEVQLTQGANANAGNNANTAIQIVLAPAGTTTFSNVQVIPSFIAIPNPPAYNQVPLIAQQGQLFGYYQPLLSYMPIPSYLVGWDFPLNPAQFLGTTIAAQATGANTGFYAWDQTIVFQTVTSGVSVARGTNGSLQLTCAANGQVAIIQYLDQTEARKILNDRASVRLSLYGSAGYVTAGAKGNVTLWATMNGALPNVATGTNATFIDTLGPTGIPATVVAGWTQIPNVYGNTGFTVPAASATNNEANDIVLNGWDLAGTAPANTATFFAIVVGFNEFSSVAPDIININSVSLNAGDIPTRPAPKTLGETLLDCEQYYWKTFETSQVPQTANGQDTGEFLFPATVAQMGGVGQVNRSNTIFFPVPMRKPPSITYYNPLTNANTIADESAAASGGAPTTSNNTTKALNFTAVSATTTAVGNILGVHIVADARLGIV